MRDEHHAPVGKGLPPAILDHLTAVLPGASEMPSKQRLCYSGEFRQGGRGTWMRYRTLEEFSITHPAFDRITGARIGPLEAVQVVDRFDGYVTVSGLRLFNRVTIRRPPVASRARHLSHYLGLLPWMPYSMLADRSLSWDAHAGCVVKVSVRDAEQTFALIRFRPNGTIESMDLHETAGSPTRLITYGSYAQISGMHLPGHIQAYLLKGDVISPYCHAALQRLDLGSES